MTNARRSNDSSQTPERITVRFRIGTPNDISDNAATDASQSVQVESGTTLTEAAELAGIRLNMPCGGEGTCGKCRVIARSLATSEDVEYAELLACQASVSESTDVLVPQTALLDESIQVMTDSHHAHDLHSTDIQASSSADRPALEFGIAFDIGTTTLAATMVDLHDGRTIAIASRMNPQTVQGDDVISRIQFAMENEDGADQMFCSITDAMNRMIDEMIGVAHCERTAIRRMTVSGNTTMQHLLTRLDVNGLGCLPFNPARLESLTVTAEELGIPLAHDATVYVLPVIGGYVGGDTVAGIACMRQAELPYLLIDIGTNGEIVLDTGKHRLATATAAGPALEGARITHGMRAVRGAIQRVHIDTCDGNSGDGCNSQRELRIETIRSARPIGLCGSGLIDAVSELLEIGIIVKQGRMLSADSPELEALELSESLRNRLVTFDNKPAFALADESESGTDHPVLLTQHDVRQLQLASGAIRAGVLMLLKRAGLTPDDLHTIYLAGGFGNYVRRSCAQRIGLLPPELHVDQIEFRGNTSLAGARMALLSDELRDELDQMARETEHVDLSTDPDFQWAFADAMIFP